MYSFVFMLQVEGSSIEEAVAAAIAMGATKDQVILRILIIIMMRHWLTVIVTGAGGAASEVDGSDACADRDGVGGEPVRLLRGAGRHDAEAGRRAAGPAGQGIHAAGGHEDRAGARAQPPAGQLPTSKCEISTRWRRG